MQGAGPRWHVEPSSRLAVIFPLAFCWDSCPQIFIPNMGREQFLKYPPDGSFLPEIGFRLWKSRLFSSPQTSYRVRCPLWLRRKENKDQKNGSWVGDSIFWGGWRVSLQCFYFQEYGTDSQCPFCGGGATGRCEEQLQRTLCEGRAVRWAPGPG